MKLPLVREYPKQVKVGEELYEVKFLKRMPNNDAGYCDPAAYRIAIKAGMSASETFATFIHEVLHAIEFEHDLTIKHSLVYKLEVALSDFLLMNF